MSEESTPTSPDPDPTPAPKPEKKAKVKKKGRWRRRIIFTLVCILVVSLLSRIIVVALLPSVVRKVASHYGLNAQYEKLELDILGGDVGIWHFTLNPQEGGANLLAAEYTRVDVSPTDLLRGRLTIRRLEAEGVDLLLERKEDGTIPLLQRFASLIPTSSANPSSPAAPRKVDLTSPLQIDAFRLTNVHAHVHDAAVAPALDAHVDLNIILTDLSSNIRPTRFIMDMSASPLLDLLHVEGTGKSNAQNLDASFHVWARGVHAQPAAGYLAPLGLKAVSRSIGLQMDATIKATPSTRPDAVAATISLDGIEATVDGQDTAGLNNLTINAGALDFTTAQIDQISLSGAHLEAYRNKAGVVSVAGFELCPRPAAASAPSSPVTVVPTGPAAPLLPLHLMVGQIAMKDMHATLHDQAVVPENDLTAALTDLTIGSVSTDKPEDSATIVGHFTAPGMVRAIQLDGKAAPLAAQKALDVTVLANGIKPDGLKPYLDAIGLESDYQDGTFSCSMHAGGALTADNKITAGASLSKLSLKDTKELLALNEAKISGVSFDPATTTIKVDAIDVSGPSSSAMRTASGAFSAFGLHTKKRPQNVATVEDSSSAHSGFSLPQGDLAAMLPKIEIGKLTWKNVKFAFDDLAVDPPSSISLSDAGVELTDLIIDLDPKDKPSKKGKLHAWLAVPNLADSITVDGTIDPRAEASAIDLSIDGKGITAEKLATYFPSANIQPVLKDGSFHLKTHFELSKVDNGLGAGLGVQDFSFKDGDQELIGADSASIDQISLAGNTLTIEGISAKAPRIVASRQADGSFLAAGVRFKLPESSKMPEKFNNLTTAPKSVDVTPTTGATLPKDFVAVLKKLHLEGATVTWTDNTVSPAAAAHLTVDTDLTNFKLGGPMQPAQLTVALHEDHAMDQISVKGVITPSLDSPSVQLDIAGVGIRAGALAPYLPPGVAIDLKDGRFKTAIDAGMNLNPAGGYAAHLFVNGLDYRDGDGGPKLFGLDNVRLVASRIDPYGKRIAIDEISVAGAEADASRSKDGIFHAFGIALNPNAPAVAHATPKAPAQADANAPVVAGAADSTAVSAVNLAGLVREKYPFVTVDKLLLGVTKISFVDQAQANSAPVVLSNWSVWNTSRLDMLGEDPSSHGALDIKVWGAIDPLIKSVNVNAQLAPFAQSPGLTVDVFASGIHGSGITDVLPILKPHLDGAPLADGRFKMHFESNIHMERHDPLDFDVSRGFDLDFSLRGVEFRDGTAGPLLAGVEEITSEGIHVQPEASTVIAKSVEITNPALDTYRDAAGIHVLGLVIKLPENLGGPATQPSQVAGAAPKPEPKPVTVSLETPAPATKPNGEIRIDKLLVTGLDVRLEDRTMKPTFLVPLTGLDLDVRDISSLMPYEDKTCKFSMIVNAGKVPLRKKAQSGDKIEYEDRELFSQVELKGKLALYPQPKGWIKSTVSAFELDGLEGPANALNETLRAGTYDSTVDVKMEGDGYAVSHSRFAVTDVSISEPPKGFIFTTFKLPAPLDAAIGLVQDEDGSITIPVDHRFALDHISGDDIASVIGGAIAPIVIKASTAKAIEAANLVTGMFGGGKPDEDMSEVVLTFAPGETSLSADDVTKLQALMLHLKKNDQLELTIHHDLGGGDVTRAAILANPSTDDAENLAHDLRLKKMDLLSARASATAQVRAQLESGFGADANEAIGRLRDLDRAIAANEDALDHVYELLRPGASRQATRRTRGAALQVGNDRLVEVRDALVSGGPAGTAARVKIVHPAFQPNQSGNGGTVTVVLSIKKKQG